jgi:hypothetical protein
MSVDGDSRKLKAVIDGINMVEQVKEQLKLNQWAAEANGDPLIDLDKVNKKLVAVQEELQAALNPPAESAR